MKILLFITSKPFPENAVAMADLIAGLTQASVSLLFIGLGEEEVDAGEKALARAQEMLSQRATEINLREGPTTGRLVAEAQDEVYHVVVLEKRQMGHLKRVLVGSRIRSLIRRGNASVLIATQPRPSLKRILICTGGTAVAEMAIKEGARLAAAAGAKVTLLHVAGSVPSMYTGLVEIEETLPKLLDSDTPIARHLRWGAELLAEQHVPGQLKLRHGVVPDEILREAQMGGYDLIVMGGPRPMGMLQAWLLGDVAWEVVDRAHCPVLVVKRADSDLAL